MGGARLLRGPARAKPSATGNRTVRLAVCAADHSPGVTTLAMALAATVGADCVLVEADSSGGDLAARLRGSDRVGLAGLLGRAHRGIDAKDVREQCQPMRAGPALLAAPTDPEEARATLSVLGPRLPAAVAGAANASVTDCGRLAPESPALPFALAAQTVVWATRAETSAVERTRARLSAMPDVARRSVVAVIGACLRPDHELSAALGVPAVGRVRWDPSGVELLGAGSPRWTRSGLWSDIAEVLDGTVAHAPRPAVVPPEAS